MLGKRIVAIITWIIILSSMSIEAINLKILNQNVLVSGGGRVSELSDFFQASGADIIALTEPWNVQNNDGWAADLNFNVIYNGDETKEQTGSFSIGGYFMPVLLMTKYEILDYSYYHYSRAAIIARILIPPSDTLAICILHLFDSHNKKMQDLGELLGFLDEYKSKIPIIVTGDFNSPSPLDGITGQDVGRLQLAYDWGLEDSYREIYPDYNAQPGYTSPGSNRRIDFILNSPELTPTLCEVTDDSYIPGGSDVSDHLGVYCEIELDQTLPVEKEIEENTESINLKIGNLQYPIWIPKNSEGILSVKNMKGEVLISQPINKAMIESDILSRGIFFVTVTGPKYQHTQKIISID